LSAPQKVGALPARTPAAQKLEAAALLARERSRVGGARGASCCEERVYYEDQNK
jgi:hypothetical protein